MCGKPQAYKSLMYIPKMAFTSSGSGRCHQPHTSFCAQIRLNEADFLSGLYSVWIIGVSVYIPRGIKCVVGP